MGKVDSQDRYEVFLRSGWQEKRLTAWEDEDEALGDARARFEKTGHTMWVYDKAEDRVVACMCRYQRRY
jgi:hypothetical protein